MKEYGFNTTLLHGTEETNPFGATQVPVYQSSAFRHDTAEELEKIFSNKMAGYSYTRINNPTIESFEKRMAKLEDGAATIHPFGGSASPKIRDAHHAMRRGYNAGGILLQGGTPFLLRHGDGFGDISLTAVGISHLIKGTFCPLPLQAVSCSNIRDGLRCLAGL